MKYTLLLGRPSETELNRLSDLIQARLSKRILSLENDPRPQGCKKLSGRQEYRVRVGDYRIVYSIDDDERTVRVIAVGHRGGIYR
jgi:mRNA interferase RelE/StbE